MLETNTKLKTFMRNQKQATTVPKKNTKLQEFLRNKLLAEEVPGENKTQNYSNFKDTDVTEITT